jgi:hypothetical protein
MVMTLVEINCNEFKTFPPQTLDATMHAEITTLKYAKLTA